MGHSRPSNSSPGRPFVRYAPDSDRRRGNAAKAAKCHSRHSTFDIWFGTKEPRHIGGSKCDGRGFERGPKGQTKKPCSESNYTICTVSNQNGASRRMTQSTISPHRVKCFGARRYPNAPEHPKTSAGESANRRSRSEGSHRGNAPFGQDIRATARKRTRWEAARWACLTAASQWPLPTCRSRTSLSASLSATACTTQPHRCSRR